MRTLLEWTATREKVLDFIKMICGALLFASPWTLEFASAATWNLRLCGYAMLTASLAALVAEADWEPRANLWLGIWVLAAPWMLGFSQDAAATLVHLFGGGVISVLSAVEVWFGERNPPWRFGPGAAQRATLSALVMTVPLDQTNPQPAIAGRGPRIPAASSRSSGVRGHFWPLRPNRPRRRTRCPNVSTGTRRLRRAACGPIRSALENKTPPAKSSRTKHLSRLAQMPASVLLASYPCCSN
jgi:SPW repeat-containing protein